MPKGHARASFTTTLVVLGMGLMPMLAACARASPVALAGTGLPGGGSVDEAWTTGATPGDSMTLLRNGVRVTSTGNPGTADALGSLVIRDLAPGGGYQWDDTTAHRASETFAVLATEHDNPATSSALYSNQPMHEGLNYITMRDGIRLAATVRFPYGRTCTTGDPCPTVIEYSGYGAAGPTDPIPFLLARATHATCTACGDPHLLPDGATDVGAVVARIVGFATVSLQMRGTGCSGGAYDLLGYPSDFDAYDTVEIAAHQGWVANHKVGMVGISYSGLSQFPSAGTDPPDLAAIAPFSPTDDLFSTGYPGGIFNDGFGLSWITERIDDAKPAATLSGGRLVPLSSAPVSGVGQPWTYYEIDAEMAANGGSSTCLQDQALHGQSRSLSTVVGPQLVAPHSGPGRERSLFDRRSMRVWAQHIRVPVFVSGALQDEQTGPQWPALLQALPPSTPVFATMVNGGHIDSTDPQIVSRWLEFLDIYVAKRVPKDPGFLGDLVLGDFASFAAGTSAQAPLPAYRFTAMPTPAMAMAAFAQETPRVEVLFDSGAGPVGAGDPQSTYTATFRTWPAEGRVVKYFFGPAGTLPTTAPVASGHASLVLDPSVRTATSLPSGRQPWAADPGWDWTVVPAPDGLAFQTGPFAADTTFVGPATVQLWVQSASPVEDYQVTVTELRPADNEEEYVTSGFLRSSNQVDRPDSTRLFTDPSYLGSDAHQLAPSRYSLVDIPVDPIAHTFRAGTELRIVISAPGGDRPVWEFATLDNGTQSATIGVGGAVASALVVNEVRGVDDTPTLPACGSLRGEPCRAYQPEGNQ